MQLQEHYRRIVKDSGDDLGQLSSSILQLSLWKLFQSGKYTDLNVTCGNRLFQVHKAIVCSQSSFFDAACSRSFKEHSENKIDLPDDDPEMIERFFQFLYLGNYSDGEYFDELPTGPALMTPNEVVGDEMEDIPVRPSNAFPSFSYTEEMDHDQAYEPLEYDSDSSDMPKDEIGLHIPNPKEDYPIALSTSLRMYILADKYDVVALKLLAKKRFILTAETNWRKYHDFPVVVDELFASTPPLDPLRGFVCCLVSDEYRTNRETRDRLRPIVLKHADFAVGMLDTITADPWTSEKLPIIIN